MARATYRDRQPQLPTIETDPDRWGPYAACQGREDLEWFDPDDDDGDVDLDRLDDDARELLAVLNARLDAAAPSRATQPFPVLDLFADDLDSEEDAAVAASQQPSGDGWDVEACKAVCATCPVAAHCLEWALEWNFADGVLGGLTFDQRDRLRRDRELPAHGTRTGYSTHGCSCPLCREGNAVWVADRRNPITAAS